MKIDFHVHTKYSYDSFMKPKKIIEIAKSRGLNGIVICDHNTVSGSLEAIKINPYSDFVIIPAAEIYTDAGDITGLFIKKEITSKKFKDVALEIKKQGGKVLLNHPFKHHNLSKIDFDLIDFIEGYNSRLTKEENQKALNLAKKHNKPILAGSDAHCYHEIGNSFTEVDNITDLFPKRWHYQKSNRIYVTLSQYIKAIKQKDIKIFISASKIMIKTILGGIIKKRK